MRPGMWAIIIVGIVIILLFAAPKIPKLARNLGQGLRIFKSEVDEMGNDSQKNKTSEESSAIEEPSSDSTSSPKNNLSATSDKTSS